MHRGRYSGPINLYVASFNNWKWRGVDPNGAFLGDFVAAGSGGFTGPNFMLFRPPATPVVTVLEIAPAGGNVALSWPTAAVGWTLQMAPALDAITTWTPVVHAVTKGGGDFTMTLPLAPGRQFFRLIQP